MPYRSFDPFETPEVQELLKASGSSITDAIKEYATPATALRIGLPIAGGIAGSLLAGPVGTAGGIKAGLLAAGGAALGGAIGEAGAEALEGQPLDPGEIALAGGLSALPAGPAARAIKPGMGLAARAGLHALEGVGQGAVDVLGTSLYRTGKLPSVEELAAGGAFGGVLGTGLGLGMERAFRPRTIEEAVAQRQAEPLEIQAVEPVSAPVETAQYSPELPYTSTPTNIAPPPIRPEMEVAPPQPTLDVAPGRTIFAPDEVRAVGGGEQLAKAKPDVLEAVPEPSTLAERPRTVDMVDTTAKVSEAPEPFIAPEAIKETALPEKGTNVPEMGRKDAPLTATIGERLGGERIVTITPQGKKYALYDETGGKRRRLGVFNSPQEASRAAERARAGTLPEPPKREPLPTYPKDETGHAIYPGEENLSPEERQLLTETVRARVTQLGQAERPGVKPILGGQTGNEVQGFVGVTSAKTAGLENVSAGQKAMDKALDRDKGNPLELEIRQAILHGDEELGAALDQMASRRGGGPSDIERSAIQEDQGDVSFEPEKYSTREPVDVRAALEYEGRLFGGSYGVGNERIAAPDSPKRTMIRQARERYNTARRELGLPEVTDWSRTPDRLIQHEFKKDGTPIPTEPEKYSVRPSPGQRGFEGIAEDVAPPREKKKAPEQEDLFGKGAMLQPTESFYSKGREAEGELFTQERDAAVKADKERQQSFAPGSAAARTGNPYAIEPPPGMRAAARQLEGELTTRRKPPTPVTEPRDSGAIAEKEAAAGMGEGKDTPKFATAYHGSPFDFDRFDSSKIGTGEGAQAYGHGLYFAGAKDVAEHYRKRLSPPDKYRSVLVNGMDEAHIYGQDVYPLRGEMTPAELKQGLGHIVYYTRLLRDPEAGLAEARRVANELADTNPDAAAAKRLFEVADVKVTKDVRHGKLYEVDLAPSEDSYLLWDEPIGRQSEQVQMALVKAGLDYEPSTLGSEAHRIASSEYGGPHTVAEMLRKAGVSGIKYLDGSSRNARPFDLVIPQQDGTTKRLSFRTRAEAEAEAEVWPSAKIEEHRGSYNYVLFDDSQVTIKEKYAKGRAEAQPTPDLVRQRFGDVATITELSNGGIGVRFKDGLPGKLEIRAGEVRYTPGDLKLARPAGLSPGREIVGSFQKMGADGLMRLKEGTGGKVLGHEELHAILAFGRLRAGEIDALWNAHGYTSTNLREKLRAAGVPDSEITTREAALKRLFAITEEKVADTVGRLIDARLAAERAGKTLKQPSWFEKIWTSLKRLWDAFSGYKSDTAESALERIASKDVYREPGKAEKAAQKVGQFVRGEKSATSGTEAPKFATAPSEPPKPEPQPKIKPIPNPPVPGAGPEARGKVAEAGKAEGGRTEGKPPKEYINLNRIGVEDDVKRMESRVTDALKEQMGEARSYRSWGDARDKAIEAGLSESDFKRLVKQKGALSDHEIEAGRILREEAFKDSREKLEKLQSLKKDSKDFADAEREYEASINRAAGVLWSTVRAGAEAGRALAIHRKMSEGLTPHERLYRSIAKGRPGLSEEFTKRFLRTDPADSKALLNLVRAEFKPSLRSMAYEFWINGLLSAPPTHLANFSGNTLTALLKIPERVMAGALDKARSTLTGAPRERFVGEAYADVMAVKEGLKKAVSAFRTDWADELHGIKSGSTTKAEQYVPKFPGKAGPVIRTPTRLLSASDEAFKALAATRESRALAYRKARMEGKKGKALADRIEDILSDLESHPDILRGMQEAAEYQTFTKHLGKFGQMAIAARDADPTGATKVIAPFMRTPINIAKYTLERTPLNFIRLADQIRKGKLEGGQIPEELAKPVLGTLIGMGFAMMAQEGLLTGGGPSDHKANQALRATGWQPYSVHVGDQYISIQRFEPFSSIAGFAADMVEAKDEKTEGDLVNKIVGSITENLTNKTFLQGVENAFLMWSDPRRYASQWAKSLEGSVVPAIIGRTAQAIDPVVRETKATDASAVLARIPFASETLEPKPGPGGEPIERSGTALERFASPAARSTEKGSEKNLERQFVDVDFVPSQPSRTITIPGTNGRKMELTDAEYRVFLDFDRRVTARLRRITQDPRFAKLSHEARRQYLERAYSQAGSAARTRVMPSVIKRWRQERASL